MRATQSIMVLLMAVVVLCPGEAFGQASMTSAFTYQGQLKDADSPANGFYDFTFALYDDPSTGSQVGITINAENKAVENGLFTVLLDFGIEAFAGDARWLEIGVRPGDNTDPHTILSPRQTVTATPYAVYAMSAGGGSGSGIGGNGTVNAIPKFTGTATLGNSVIHESGGFIGIGGTTPGQTLDVWGSIRSKDVPETGGKNIIIGNDAYLADIDEVDTLGIYGNVHATEGHVKLGSNGPVLSGYSQNFGIGIAVPTSRLHVNGNAVITGKLGVNVTSPAERLDVGGNIRLRGSQIQDSDGTARIIVDHDGALDLADANGTAALSVAAPGLVGIATASPDYALDVNGQAGFNEYLYHNEDTDTYIRFTPDQTNFYSGGLQMLTLDGDTQHAAVINEAGTDLTFRVESDTKTAALYVSGTNGQVGIGTDKPMAHLHVAGSACVTSALAVGTTVPTTELDVQGTARLRDMDSGSGTPVQVDTMGVLIKQSSSRRYKEDIKDLDETNRILRLQPVQFTWRTTGTKDVGLIAEDVAEHMKDLVIYDTQGRPDAVKYDKVALYLLELVKELKSENQTLKRRIEALEQAANESIPRSREEGQP